MIVWLKDQHLEPVMKKDFEGLPEVPEDGPEQKKKEIKEERDKLKKEMEAAENKKPAYYDEALRKILDTIQSYENTNDMTRKTIVVRCVADVPGFEDEIDKVFVSFTDRNHVFAKSSPEDRKQGKKDKDDKRFVLVRISKALEDARKLATSAGIPGKAADVKDLGSDRNPLKALAQTAANSILEEGAVAHIIKDDVCFSQQGEWTRTDLMLSL